MNTMRFLMPLLLLAPARAQEASAAAPSANQAPKLVDIEADRQEFVPFLKKLAAEMGVAVQPVGYTPGLVTLKLRQVTFEKALEAATRALNLSFRKHEDGRFFVGHATDLLVEFSEPTDTAEVDITYRCRHLSAESLANLITRSFPTVRAFSGPVFLSPTLESGTNSTGSDSVKALGSTDQAFKTHDVLISGPVNFVKRALVLARKFDRVRKQVRINAKLTEVSDDFSSQLGINWTFPSNYAIQEIPDATQPPGLDKTAKGIRFGSFAHTAISIGAAIQAQEKDGKAKTLANPSISLLDGERSFILIGERRLYPKQTGTSSQGLPIFDVAEVKTGVYLQVAVQVGLDNEMVLTVYPQVSNVKNNVTINGSQYPVIATREAQTTVQLRSGEMLAIGGLLSEADTKDVTKVPILGYIPLIGELFTFRDKRKGKSELLLLITPEIIDREGETDIIKSSQP